MGKHSSLGPIDPQFGGMPAHGIIEEFETAKKEIAANPATMAVWQPILAKYPPAFVGECAKAITWANNMVRAWIETGMYAGDPGASTAADKILGELADHALTLSHSRHISMEKAKDLGIKIVELEEDQALQDAVLTVHHACVQTLAESPAFKIIENQNGISFITSVTVGGQPQPR